MKAFQQRALELARQGHSPAAIAVKMNIEIHTAKEYLHRHHISKFEPTPEGYMTAKEASGYANVHYHTLCNAMRLGYLKFVWCGSRRFTTQHWLRTWLDNAHYRDKAKALRQAVADSASRGLLSSPFGR